jgi:hypothetical protein
MNDLVHDGRGFETKILCEFLIGVLACLFSVLIECLEEEAIVEIGTRLHILLHDLF